jgi:ketosteroid isomerase-like protein
MATPLRRTTEDEVLREQIGTLAQAIRDKDIDALMTHYAPDIIAYDVMPPLAVQGIADYRKNYEQWFATFQGPIDFQMTDLRISVGECHAFCHAVSRVSGKETSGSRADYRVRVTICFQKANGQWLVAHEHVSRPATM